MHAVAEPKQQYPDREDQRPRLAPVPIHSPAPAIPTIEDVLGYTMNVDFSDASKRGEQLSGLVREAAEMLLEDRDADTSRIEQDIETILLDDAQHLDTFARIFVDGLMPYHTAKPGTCGLAGMRYNNAYSGETGLLLFKTRVKKGRNTLAKVFRKCNIDEEMAAEILTSYESDPDNDNKHPYQLDPEAHTVTYKMTDLSAARAVFETEDGIERMRAWIYLHPEMEVVSEEYKDNPTYQADHLEVRYRGKVREVQLMTAEAERIANEDPYHNPIKNDVAHQACGPQK